MRVLVAGAGGVGFWMALALSRLVPHEIVVYDDDDLSGTGATRLPDVRLFGRPFRKGGENGKRMRSAMACSEDRLFAAG